MSIYHGCVSFELKEAGKTGVRGVYTLRTPVFPKLFNLFETHPID